MGETPIYLFMGKKHISPETKDGIRIIKDWGNLSLRENLPIYLVPECRNEITGVTVEITEHNRPKR